MDNRNSAELVSAGSYSLLVSQHSDCGIQRMAMYVGRLYTVPRRTLFLLACQPNVASEGCIWTLVCGYSPFPPPPVPSLTNQAMLLETVDEGGFLDVSKIRSKPFHSYLLPQVKPTTHWNPSGDN